MKQALAFCREGPEPTADECRVFVAWHSRGADLPLTPAGLLLEPGLLRLVRGFKTMGMLMGPVEEFGSWAHGFRCGELFLDDFIDENYDSVVTPLAFRRYEQMFGSIPHYATLDKEGRQALQGEYNRPGRRI